MRERVLTRSDLQHISELRLGEARILLSNHCYNGAYYLAGYVVECGLKACIARETKRFEFPDKSFAADCYTHDLAKLVKLTGLGQDLQAELDKKNDFSKYWLTVKDWSEQDRYSASRTKTEADDIYRAVASRRHGVLRWIRRFW